MKVTQVYELVNATTQEVLGESAVVKEDLSNVVEIGDAIIGANAVDNYVRTLVDHIGKVVFVNRKYSGSAPSVLMDGWEYGSIVEKIQCEMPVAVSNSTWELKNGQSYDPNIFNGPKVSAKFFNNRISFEIDQSITEKQVKSAFSSATQLNSFVSMIHNEIDKSLTVKIDSLIMSTINSMTAHTLLDEFPDNTYTGVTGVKAVNLLFLYNTKYTKTLTPEQAITDPEFIRFASYTMANYKNRISKLSTLFNIGKKPRFTSSDRLHIVMLSDFKNASDIYLQSDTYHKELVSLPTCEVVPYWQGSGTDFSFNEISDIHVAVKDAEGQSKIVHSSGILGVMFDREALGVTNISRKVTTNYNAKAEFVNYFYKYFAGYFNDLDENFVVFYVA